MRALPDILSILNSESSNCGSASSLVQWLSATSSGYPNRLSVLPAVPPYADEKEPMGEAPGHDSDEGHTLQTSTLTRTV